MRMTSSSPARRKVLLQHEVKPLVEQFLSERGLELSHEKTRITHIEDGFDFLGQTVRRYRNGKVLLQAVAEEREDVPGQDPGSDRRQRAAGRRGN